MATQNRPRPGARQPTLTDTGRALSIQFVSIDPGIQCSAVLRTKYQTGHLDIWDIWTPVLPSRLRKLPSWSLDLPTRDAFLLVANVWSTSCCSVCSSFSPKSRVRTRRPNIEFLLLAALDICHRPHLSTTLTRIRPRRKVPAPSHPSPLSCIRLHNACVAARPHHAIGSIWLPHSKTVSTIQGGNLICYSIARIYSCLLPSRPELDQRSWGKKEGRRVPRLILLNSSTFKRQVVFVSWTSVSIPSLTCCRSRLAIIVLP